MISTVERTYGIDLNVRGDMLIGNLLDERGFDSVTQLLTAYRGKLRQHARKRRLFLSFHAEDRYQVEAFRALARDPDVDVDFYDGSLRQPVSSERGQYIKRVIRPKIQRASVLVCLIGNGTAWRDWVDWELDYAVRSRKGICGVRLEGSHGRRPDLLRALDAPIAHWDHAQIVAAIECAAARRS